MAKLIPERALSRATDVLRFTWRHPSNRSRRLRAVGRVAAFQMRGRLTGARTIVPVGEHSRIWADARVYTSARATYGNPLDWNEMLAWRRALAGGGFFVDVGANVGIYTLWAIDCGADVLAVEPNPLSVERLEENLALNGYRAEIARAAVGDAPGTLRMTTALDQQNHLLLDGHDAGDEVEVEVTTLDHLVGDRHVTGLKIDVEGAEALVLRGAERLLSEQRVALMQLEWNSASQLLLQQDRTPVREILRSHGYELCRPDEHGVLVPTDAEGYGPDVFARPVARR